MYEDWIAKEHAITRTGLTARTLERMVVAGKLRREYVHIPGRKALPVFNPIDIAQLENKTLKPSPIKKNKATRQTTTQTDIAALRLVAMALSFSHLRYFTKEQAAFFLGVSPTYIDRAQKAGLLPALKIPGVRGVRFERQALRQHQVSLSLSGSQKKQLNGDARNSLYAGITSL